MMDTPMQTLFEKIAADHLQIETLETRNHDRLDFHDVSVWGVKSALEAAYEAGRNDKAREAKQTMAYRGLTAMELSDFKEWLKTLSDRALTNALGKWGAATQRGALVRAEQTSRNESRA
jgi:hypothetical protein